MIRVLSQYMGSLDFWSRLLQEEQVCIEQEDHFVKQTFRNRTVILGPNGLQSLIVPIQGRNKRQSMKQVKIGYGEAWERIHLNSIQTAYRSAPYFDYLYPEIERIIQKKPVYLLDLNEELRAFFVKRLQCDTEFSRSTSYELNAEEQDGRDLFHPKKETPAEGYPQVFQEKFGFVSGAGILDLLMNDLTGAAAYLKQRNLQ